MHFVHLGQRSLHFDAMKHPVKDIHVTKSGTIITATKQPSNVKPSVSSKPFLLLCTKTLFPIVEAFRTTAFLSDLELLSS